MSEKKPLSVDCPNCKKPVLWVASNEFRPFCSKRCQLIDLGEWANESHVISGKPGFTDNLMPLDEEEIEAMLHQQEQAFFK